MVGRSVEAVDGEPRSQGQKIARRYQYDAVGQVKTIEDLRKGSTQYQYDELGRLLGAQHPFLKETFAFDPAHNLMSEQHVAEQKQRTANTRWTEEQWQAYVQANQHAPNPVVWIDPFGLCPGKLGKNMGARVGDDMANHHLIPEELMKRDEYKSLFDNAKKSGWDGDAASNGIFLPDNKDLAKTLDLPRHWSSHRNYTESIKSDLHVLNEQFRRGKLSDMDVVLGLGDIQRRARSGLEGGAFSTGKNGRLN